MANGSPDDNQRVAYNALRNSYHSIDDFRAKLLGLLPLATGTGIFLVLSNMSAERMAELKAEFGVVGCFGFLITLGLYSFELYGIKKCHALIKAGKTIERSLEIEGHFTTRPRELAGVVNEPFAAGIIYPAVLAAWTYVAIFNYSRPAGRAAAILVFVAGFALSLAYNLLMGRPAKTAAQRGTPEPSAQLREDGKSGTA